MLLDLTKNTELKNLIYASTSSIYGSQSKFPIKENFDTNNPTQLYAATKKSNEVIAASYNKLFYNIKTIGLRFFTVYGPWGRPDMAPIKFAKIFLRESQLKYSTKEIIFRDFTFVDDIVDGVFKIITKKIKSFLKIKFTILVTAKKFHYLTI